ncbi:MAG: hypothetical protein JNJ61_30390 [Anaerolineae bacterium]|nr:hypothetical protein [Anaerolineae bacterium]
MPLLLLVAAARLAGLCALLCLGAGMLGHALLPDDARATSLQTCGGAACALGITPGSTSWEAAYRAFSGTDGQLSAKSIVVRLRPRAEAALYVSVNRVHVGRIALSFMEPLDLGWVLARYGTPCGVSIYRGAQMLTLRYPFLLANVNLTGERLDSRLPVTSIQYKDPAFEMAIQPDMCVDPVTDLAVNTDWHGFAPLWHYLLSQ